MMQAATMELAMRGGAAEEKTTQLWNEYAALREEMKSADTVNYQILGAVVAAAAVIFTAALGQSTALGRMFAFLTVFVITLPAYRLLVGNRRRTWRIATYLRVFLEPGLEFTRWETRLSAIGNARTDRKQWLSSLAVTNEWFTVMLMNSIASVAAALSLLQTSLPMKGQGVGCAALGVVLLVTYLSTAGQERRLRRGGEVEAEFLRTWSELKAGEAVSGSGSD